MSPNSKLLITFSLLLFLNIEQGKLFISSEDKTILTEVNFSSAFFLFTVKSYLTCNDNPCKNGASCSDSMYGYTCTCVNNWRGRDCDNFGKIGYIYHHDIA